MKQDNQFSIALIGAGIMSATLGIFLKKLMPFATISIYERLDRVAAESSDAWNNAGTGHSAFCELNYTPEDKNGKVDVSKALKIAESFEVSKQFWAYLVENKLIKTTTPFINEVDHISFVWGTENVAFLEHRATEMKKHALFQEMKFSSTFEEIASWIPLVMTGRDKKQVVGATKVNIGTDVNFGALTKGMVEYLTSLEDVELFLGAQIEDIKRRSDERWELEILDLQTESSGNKVFDFVFIGAGGGAITLLEKTDIPEAEGFGGFPVSGQFFKCTNEKIIAQHSSKVYGKADVGAPPMSVPHLDARMIEGKKTLLFGPYAGFSTKFLKNGSYFDLPLSMDSHNLWPMISAGYKNLGLTKYLITQVAQSDESRMKALQNYFPDANPSDWELITAGQRVQIIKRNEEGEGELQFGTEIVASSDGSLAALLGASPGASTSVSIMIDLLNKCFSAQMQSEEWATSIREMIPSFGESLAENGALCTETRERTTKILKLEN